MSQVKPMALVESMSGKICGHSDMYFFRKNGKVFSGKICNPSTKEPTAAQQAQRTKFATARANELGELIGAASSLSLVVAGLMTALLFPLLTSLI